MNGQKLGSVFNPICMNKWNEERTIRHEELFRAFCMWLCAFVVEFNNIFIGHPIMYLYEHLTVSAHRDGYGVVCVYECVFECHVIHVVQIYII